MGKFANRILKVRPQTRRLKEGKRLEGEIEKVHDAFKKTKKVNKQV
jgi:hypothetical protein